MNNERRKALGKLKEQISDLRVKLDELIGNAADLHSELEGLKDEEQEYFDNMPESLQGGDKGQTAEEAIQNLETALEKLDELKDLENGLEEACDAIESACG